MDRARRLASLWNWLPVFRAVAELEHLQKAARTLHVSPSAVSRTIRLLEEDVGQPLFVRRGRALELNEAGRSLLSSVRDAMRRVDDGLEAIVAAPTTVRVACAGDHPLSLLWRALTHIQREHAPLVARVVSAPASDVPSMLLRGELDVAFAIRPLRAAGLHIEAVGTITHGIFCGSTHPLFGLESVSLRDALRHSFAAPSLDVSHGVTDCWPVEIERHVAIYLPALAPALEMCAAGEALVVLPDALPAASGLFRLPVDVIEPVRLFAVRRKQLVEPDISDIVIQAMRLQMRAPSRPPTPTPRKPNGASKTSPTSAARREQKELPVSR